MAKKIEVTFNKKDSKGVLKTLREIKTFLTRARWVQGDYTTVDDNGVPQFCLIGSVAEVSGSFKAMTIDFMHEIASTRGFMSTEDFNDDDTTDYRKVQRFLDRSIKLVEQHLESLYA